VRPQPPVVTPRSGSVRAGRPSPRHLLRRATAVLAALAIPLSAAIAPSPEARADVTAGCTPTDGYTNCVVVTYANPGANQTVRIPAGVTAVDVRMWGAGGGGAHTTPYPGAPGGGSGAFVAGIVPTSGGVTWNVTVGWGGYAASNLQPFGNGGPGGSATGGTPHGSAGGGTTALWTGAAFASAPLLVAGAGGGGAAGSPGAGGGGGAAGDVGGSGAGGSTANPTGGGASGGTGAVAPGCTTQAGDGSAYAGGAGGSGTEGGGGGGGGWFGGGGGQCQSGGSPQNGSGAGGSSYIAPEVLSPRTEAGQPGAAAGANAAPGGTGDPVYGYAGNVGIGGMTVGIGQAGGAGMVVLQWTMPAPIITAPASGTVSTNAAPVVHGTAAAGNTVTVTDGPGGTALCSATAAADGTWSCTSSTLADGTHALAATQTNSFADVYPASATVDYTVDTTPPSAPTITDPSTTTNRSPTITGSGEPGSSVTVQTSGGAPVCGPVTVPSSGIWTCAPSSALPYGANSLVPSASDALGNTAVGPAFTVTITTPVIPPPRPAPDPPARTTPTPVAPSPSAAPLPVPPAPPKKPAPPAPAAETPVPMNLAMRAGEIVRGEVGRFDLTLGANPADKPVTLTLTGSVTRGFIYRSVQVDPAAECTVRTVTFSCTVVLPPGGTAQVTIRLLADALTAPASASQQLSVSSSAVPALDNSATVTTRVADGSLSDTQSFAAAITDQPGTFLVLLALLLLALAATVAARTPRTTERS
jgi:hypothetical protein